MSLATLFPSLKERLIIFSIAVLALFLIGFHFYKQDLLAKQLTAIQSQVVATQQLANNVVLAQSTWATKADLQAFAQQNNTDLGVIQSNLNSLNASLTAIGQATANSSGEQASNLPSSSSTPGPVATEPTSTASCNGQQVTCTNPDTYGYLSKTQDLSLTENFAATSGGTPTVVPIGSVSFSASQQNPWAVNLVPRTYNITTTLGTKNDGSGQDVEYNQLTVVEGTQSYSVPINKSDFVQQVPTAKFSFWNPRLFLGIDGGINASSLPVKADAAGSVRASVISYGTTTAQPDWSILQLGLGYGLNSKEVQVSVVPFAYNIGNLLKPLTQNTYIGPAIDIGLNGSVTPGASLALGF